MGHILYQFLAGAVPQEHDHFMPKNPSNYGDADAWFEAQTPYYLDFHNVVCYAILFSFVAETANYKICETTLGQNTKDPTTCRNSERIGVEKLGQRPKMSSNGEPLGAGLHCIYTTLHEDYARLSMRLCTVQCYVSDVIVELRLCRMTLREAVCTA